MGLYGRLEGEFVPGRVTACQTTRCCERSEGKTRGCQGNSDMDPVLVLTCEAICVPGCRDPCPLCRRARGAGWEAPWVSPCRRPPGVHLYFPGTGWPLGRGASGNRSGGPSAGIHLQT